MAAIVSVEDLRKVYASGFEALKGVSLDIEEGEILAMLGPNGAGKTTLISTICGITVPTSGRITVGGHDVVTDYRAARALIGLVPQEISLQPFDDGDRHRPLHPRPLRQAARRRLHRARCSASSASGTSATPRSRSSRAA